MAEPINLDYLNDIIDGDPSLLRMLSATFNDSAVAILAELRNAIDSDNPALWAAKSHELKGAASSFGAQALMETCTLAKAEGPSESLLEIMQLQFQAVQEALGQVIKP